MVGNNQKSVKVEGRLNEREKNREGKKVGISDMVVMNGKEINKRIKDKMGIKGLYKKRVKIEGEVWKIDVGQQNNGDEVGKKGWDVRKLKRKERWVKKVVRKLGKYKQWEQEI